MFSLSTDGTPPRDIRSRFTTTTITTTTIIQECFHAGILSIAFRHL